MNKFRRWLRSWAQLVFAATAISLCIGVVLVVYFYAPLWVWVPFIILFCTGIVAAFDVL
jgi:hypothetical protein